MHILITLLLVASLLHITASTVYHVMPDNHYHPINDNTYTLQHYLNNTNKYFTSNIQLHFLPGQYYLNNDLIIQGVCNFSLIGSRTNEVINTVINCTSPAGIVVVNSSNIVIANIVMNECGNNYSTFLNNCYSFEGKITYLISLLFLQSKLVNCTHFCANKEAGGVQFINPLVNTQLSYVTANILGIWYNEHADNANHTFQVSNFQFHGNISDAYSVKIKQFNILSNISMTIQHIDFNKPQALHIICVNCTGYSSIIISDCNFTSKLEIVDSLYDYDYVFEFYGDIEEPPYNYVYDNNTFTYSNTTVYAYYEDLQMVNKPNNIQLINCHFMNNYGIKKLIQITQNGINNKIANLIASITDCVFHNNHYAQVLSVNCRSNNQNYCILLMIKNTTISFNMHIERSLVYTYRTNIEIQQMKVISNYIYDRYGFRQISYSIFHMKSSYIQFDKYNEFFNNTSPTGINVLSIYVQENATINFTLNTMTPAIYVPPSMYSTDTKVIVQCPIQYISKKGNLDKQFKTGDKLNYFVSFHNNSISAVSNVDMMHCSWDYLYSAFITTRASLVNKRFVTYNNSNNVHTYICLCNKNMPKNCHNTDFGPSYPGQNIIFRLILADNNTKQAVISTMDQSDIACGHEEHKSTIFQLQHDKCITIKHRVIYNSRGWCEFALYIDIKYTERISEIGAQVYTILLWPCPKGFSLHLEEYCECDQILSSYIPSLTHCNIDDQTIPRPANSWISAHTVNNSHSYHVSLHCPFDYCLPHSSHLNLSTPDSQCQFHRSGLLCGQCQQGLSAVFGSSQCKHCSNVYLLIIIPIVIAGIVLVLLLFVLNLTVTDGNINPILLSVNIISINTSSIFPTNNSIMHTFISLANLDLGIETCFYDGMDEYAKRWLQLAFPAYLILIAMVIITTSRYSTKIQRLTARRALPVLATLFLLSYTKVLLTVSNVLFYYSTITNLPSNNTTPVWSVETSVPVFGLKFTILFITCLLLFIVLIPFNVVLIFTRTLSYFRVVTYFKPLLDAYQGPYKIKFYYWTGLQLVIRSIFFGLSALDKDINMMISIILLGVVICLQKVFPFNKTINNILEMLSLLNLQAIFVIAYFMNTNNIMINAIVSLVMFQLMCIVLFHMKVLFCNNVNFTKRILTKLGKWFPCFRQKECQRRPIKLANVVPEVMYNYKEFQEPLIGQD